MAVQLVKLGGSVLTVKDRLRTLRSEAILRLAGELAVAGSDLVVVHGAGSFGHLKAREYGLDAARPDTLRPDAVAEVQRDVRALHLAVLDALLGAGLPAVGVPGALVARFRDGRPDGVATEPFLAYRERGLVPVTFGDVVLDTVRGVAICSGDDLMHALADALRPARVVFVADVDGVYTADPKVDPGARRLDVLDEKGLTGVAMDAPAAGDVTGGMEGKLRKMLAIAALTPECLIVNGAVPGRLRDALLGRAAVATRVVADRG